MSRQNILMVLSNHASGWYLPEFAHPYQVLSPHSNITIASPNGGPTTLDPISVEQFKDDAYCMEFMNTKKDLWMNTKKLADFLGKADQYSAIFVVGGFGPMFDLVNNPTSIQLLKEFFEADKYIAAVCHGSAALVNVILADGTHLLSGEKVTGFSDAEEVIANRPKDMPFHLQGALDVSSGGNYEKHAEPWNPLVVVSETKKLMTGQNPASAGGLAGELLKKLEGKA